MPAFFTKPSDTIANRVVSDFGSIKEHETAELQRIDRVFGPSDLFVPYYVTPYAQNLNPADHPDDETGLVSRTNAFTLLSQFLAQKNFSHAFVLSDAGMGKTSLLVVLKLAHINKLVNPDWDMRLLKLGRDSLDEVAKIENPASTVLLLDALDEDPEAWSQFYTRLQELLQDTQNFRKVLITCRTQFFPAEHEEDAKTPGVVTLHGFACSKLFISPFDDEQVERYLEKRFPDEGSRKNATAIVAQMRSLKFRPMLLSYIELLLGQSRTYETSYDLYDELVTQWLNRELKKGVIQHKQPVMEACTAIAQHMHREQEQSIQRITIDALCAWIEGIDRLPEMSVEGRSLLHRKSDGSYKFAHQSILEFFIARSLIHSPLRIRMTDQIHAFLVDNLCKGTIRKLSDIDLDGISLGGIEIKSLEAPKTLWRKARLLRCALNHGVFQAADFGHSSIADCDFSDCNFDSAILSNVHADSTRFKGTRFHQAQLDGMECSKCDLTDTALEGASLDNAHFLECEFTELKLLERKVNGTKLAASKFTRLEIASCELNSVSLVHSSAAHTNLQDTIFSKVQLTGSVLNGALLSRCRFVGCTLDNISLEASTLTSCSIDSSTSPSSNWTRTRHEDTVIVRTSLTSSLFDDAGLRKAKIDHCIVNGTRFLRSDLSEAKITYCQGTDTDFSGATLCSTVLHESEFVNARFESSDLSRADFRRATIAGSKFAGAKLNYTNFEDSILTGCDFTGCDTSTAIFTHANLRRCHFEGCKLRRLRGAIMEGTFFEGADLNGATLDETNLQHASLEGAKLIGASMTKANLNHAQLTGADLTGAILTRAILTNTDLRGADLRRAKVDDAVFAGAVIDFATRLPEGMSRIQIEAASASLPRRAP